MRLSDQRLKRPKERARNLSEGQTDARRPLGSNRYLIERGGKGRGSITAKSRTDMSFRIGSMRVSKLGIINLGIALVAQVICVSWSWTKRTPGDDTTIVEVALGIAWNLIPYGFALALSCCKKDFEPLNIISSLCLLFLILIYLDVSIGPGNSTSGLALAFWPIWHTVGLVIITAFISAFGARMKKRSAEGDDNGGSRDEEEQRF